MNPGRARARPRHTRHLSNISPTRSWAGLRCTPVGTAEFDMRSASVASLDAWPHTTPNRLAQKGLIWFEHEASYAAKVRNVSYLRGQLNQSLPGWGSTPSLRTRPAGGPSLILRHSPSSGCTKYDTHVLGAQQSAAALRLSCRLTGANPRQGLTRGQQTQSAGRLSGRGDRFVTLPVVIPRSMTAP